MTECNILKTIFKNLSKQKIFVLTETLKKHPHQGWMSRAFTIESSIGPLIIHISKLVKEHQRNKVWEKFIGIKNIFASHPEIPAPKILYASFSKGAFILIQNFLEGIPAGKRVLNREIISDKWHADKNITVPKILDTLAKLHKIQLKGFGWPAQSKNNLKGPYQTWQNFFEKESPLWIQTIKKKEKDFPYDKLKSFVQKTIKQIDYSGPAVFIHGDAINPSNILVDSKKKIFLLDWEWSISGDPAWEFCDLGWWQFLNRNILLPYFKEHGIANIQKQKKFLQRIQLYITLWLLWGAYMHANDSNLDVYIALRKLLLEKIS